MLNVPSPDPLIHQSRTTAGCVWPFACSSARVRPAESTNAMIPAAAHPMSASAISTTTTRRCRARRISTT
jgi:hypothetical protein